ncbi:hypothetical protein E4U42_007886 [Claviceps africana]|uniref:Selenoprotein O n=1 Tax=Claviceps africana TaxID=83212 RepID=A0A8K0J171_9HYPO|nr:hypothetical protein E4U42_007886 [Claviceps africana]
MATHHTAATTGATLKDLPKSWHFTDSLPADAQYPTPAASHKTPRDEIQPRQVHNAIFTWVRPQEQKDPKVLAVSPAALRDLGIQADEAKTDDFCQFVAGNKLYGWDEETLQGGYPWAQCYGGYQFGQWAGQLGDGRAISLFETRNPATGKRYELQIKGAGITPYSRFADGKAVLRSSIREFVVSEALHALGIPTTRALSLTLLPHSVARREILESAAIVLRFAESWIRLGTFNILRAREDRDLIRRLATYVAEDVFGGWETLPARWHKLEKADGSPPPEHGVGKEDLEGPAETAENRFTRLYREIVRRNAKCVAGWQAYGFVNGVLNTDNTSVYGLSMDFGPFAFMDNFDPSYTANHDDYLSRYSYKNQPTVIWWNLVRLGEALGELMGAGGLVDDATFISRGVMEDQQEEIVSRAEKLIMQTGDEYKETFLDEYKRLMAARFGFRQLKDTDSDDLFSPALKILERYKIDFTLFFRRLSDMKLSDIASQEAREEATRVFHYSYIIFEDEEEEEMAEWLEKWRARIIEDWGDGGEQISDAREQERQQAMKRVNPNFIPRGWVLDEVIDQVDHAKDDVLRRIMHMALHPFEDEWHGKTFDGVEYEGDAEEEKRWVGTVPRGRRAMKCSCSS